MELDWENLVVDWDGLGLGDYSGPKRNLGNSSNRDCMFASRDYAVAVSRPRSGVPVALAEYEK